MAGTSRSTVADIHITDIEAAINFWRARRRPADGPALGPELRALAEVYALLAVRRLDALDEHALPAPARAAWDAWYETTPDTPCIAICSTAQGDPVCKGCGRTFDEVQHWPALGAAQKRQVWRRITAQGEAWRFNWYAERAAAGTAATGA